MSRSAETASRGGAHHHRVAPVGLGNVVAKEISHSHTPRDPPFGVGVLLGPVEHKAFLTGEAVAQPRALHVGEMAHEAVKTHASRGRDRAQHVVRGVAQLLGDQKGRASALSSYLADDDGPGSDGP
jgi:hypothetical protein